MNRPDRTTTFEVSATFDRYIAMFGWSVAMLAGLAAIAGIIGIVRS